MAFLTFNFQARSIKCASLALVSAFLFCYNLQAVSALRPSAKVIAETKTLGKNTASKTTLTNGASSKISHGNLEQGYLLNLESNFPEKYKVQVTKSGIRIDFSNAKCSLVSRAPEWNVVAWSDTNRTIMPITKSDWLHKYQMKKLLWPAELRTPRKVKLEKFKGFPAINCTFPSTEVIGLWMKSAVGKKNNTDNQNDNNSATVICLDCAAGKNSGSVFARLFGMPQLPGVPLVVRRKRSNGVYEWALSTKSITRAQISSVAFTTPQGYKKMPFNETFFISKAQMQNVKNMMESYLEQ